MIRKNSSWISFVTSVLITFIILYLYINYNQSFIYLLVLPIILILERLNIILNPEMLITKKEVLKIIFIVYVLAVVAVIANDLYKDRPIYSMINHAVGLSMLYLAFIILPAIILYFIPSAIFRHQKIKTGKLKNFYKLKQAVLFISQRLNDDLCKKITEDDILDMLLIKYNLADKDIEYVGKNKFDYKTILLNDELINIIKEKINNKFNEYEIAEIFEIEKLYIKELGF